MQYRILLAAALFLWLPALLGADANGAGTAAQPAATAGRSLEELNHSPIQDKLPGRRGIQPGRRRRAAHQRLSETEHRRLGLHPD